jgi:peptide/nickel transport system substrate-binding protein
MDKATGRGARRQRRLAVPSAVAIAALLGGASAGSPAFAAEPTSAGTAAPYFDIGECCGWGSTWSYNPFSSAWPGQLNDLTLLPLAVQVPPNMTGFVPQLATSWQAQGNELVIHLRSGLKWQDGSTFTSTDVVDTALLQGTEGNFSWGYFTNVTAPSPEEVVFTARPGVPMASLEQGVLGQEIYPSSVFGRFVTPNLDQEEVAYYNEAAKNASAASNSAAGKALAAVFSKLVEYAPSKLVGDGPFQLVSMTTGEIKLTKWDGFYDASQIHQPGILFRNGSSNNLIYPWLLDNTTDFSNAYLPPTVVEALKAKPEWHIAIANSFEFNLLFNNQRYPFNMTKVRQAIAYVLPRATMVSATYGTVDPDAAVEPHPDGLSPWMEGSYLTPGEIKQLNPYNLDPAKATALLKSAGFRLSGGNWVTPKGKPFTLSIYIQSSATDVVQSMEVAVNALDSFGIQTTLEAIPGSEILPDLETGTADMSWVTTINLDPLTEFADVLGHETSSIGGVGGGYNFPVLGTYKGDKGLGFGPVENVPGLGKVNVPNAITTQAATVPPGKKMDQLVWDWARLVNQQVPYIQWENKLHQYAFSTTRYTDWPPLGAQGQATALWNDLSYSGNPGLLLMMEGGYIRPRA